MYERSPKFVGPNLFNLRAKYMLKNHQIVLHLELKGLWDSGEGTVGSTVVVGGVLSARVTAAQHYRMCWPGFQCLTDLSMYP